MENNRKIVMRSPAECSEQELCCFKKLVLKGAEVIPQGLDGRIKNALRLAWVEIESEMVGVAALKNPKSSYRDRVFEKARSSEQPCKWKYELGWIYVKENHRGKKCASGLVRKLLTNSDSVYATARENNCTVAKLLKKFGFKQSGRPYLSACRSYKLLLYVQQPDDA